MNQFVNVEVRVGHTDVASEPDGEQFTANTPCDAPKTYVTGGFSNVFYECGSPINGDRVSLQTLSPVTLSVSEVAIYITGLEESELFLLFII